MTDNLQNTPDTTQPKRRGKHLSQALQRPKKKFSPTKLVLTILLAASPFIFNFVEDHPPWSSLNQEQKELRFLWAYDSLENLEIALASGMPVDTKIWNKLGLLHVIVTSEKLEMSQREKMLRALLAAGADIELESVGTTPLGAVLWTQNADWKQEADLLIELGANLDEAKITCMWPEMFFIRSVAPYALAEDSNPTSTYPWLNVGKPKIASGEGREIAEKNEDPKESTSWRAYRERLDWKEAMRWLATKYGPDKATVEKKKSNNLRMALSARKTPEVITFLLEMGADPNPPGGSSMLNFVAAGWKTYRCKVGEEIVQILLDEGTDPNHGNDTASPLFHAANSCCEHTRGIITLLLEAGADPTFERVVVWKKRKGPPNKLYDIQFGLEVSSTSIIEAARNNEALQGTPELEALEKAVAAAEIESATAKR